MQPEAISQRWLRWALETGLALLVSVTIFVLWPRLDLPRLGREEIWFALGWLIILAGPSALLAWKPSLQRDEVSHTFEAEALSHAAFVLAGLFAVFLAAGRGLGNYKLWLGLIYLSGITLRLAGLAVTLRAFMPKRGSPDLASALAGAGISALACLLIIPWVRPDLAAVWPPPAGATAELAAAALLWGGVSGAALLVMRAWGASQRASWLAYLAVGLGPGPALAVSWFKLGPLALAFIVLAGMAAPRIIGRRGRRPPEPDAPRPMRLYWLLRALMLLWWGVGMAVALSAAWWQPRLDALISESIWLRALALGGFLILCVGLLAEYSLPLLGKASLISSGKERKPLGVILSSAALMLAFTPLLWLQPVRAPGEPLGATMSSRAELLAAPTSLGPKNPELEVKVPQWVQGLTRVLMVSLLTNGMDVPQGEIVAQLVAVDDTDLPHIFSLRAGIDTAEWALAKSELAAGAKHGPAPIARTWTVYSPSGEAYLAHSYLTGLYLGRKVGGLKSIRLRYLYKNSPGRPPVRLQVKRIFVQ